MSCDIAILILFYNKVDQTIDCINSYLPSGQKIYVLNNGSDILQWKKLEEVFKNNISVILKDAEKNLGVSGGRNLLIKATTEKWLFFSDNDITLQNGTELSQLFKLFVLKHPDVKIVCPAVYNAHENEWALGIRIREEGKKIEMKTGIFDVTNCFPGGASIVHRSIFEEYDLFEENMFVGFEDYEFAVRALRSKAGPFKAFACNEIKLVHDHKFQKKVGDKQSIRERYSEKNLETSYNYFLKKHDIIFDHDWRWWSKKQLKEMTHEKPLKKLGLFMKQWIRKYLR